MSSRGNKRGHGDSARGHQHNSGRGNQNSGRGSHSSGRENFNDSGRGSHSSGRGNFNDSGRGSHSSGRGNHSDSGRGRGHTSSDSNSGKQFKHEGGAGKQANFSHGTGGKTNPDHIKEKYQQQNHHKSEPFFKKPSNQIQPSNPFTQKDNLVSHASQVRSSTQSVTLTIHSTQVDSLKLINSALNLNFLNQQKTPHASSEGHRVSPLQQMRPALKSAPLPQHSHSAPVRNFQPRQNPFQQIRPKFTNQTSPQRFAPPYKRPFEPRQHFPHQIRPKQQNESFSQHHGSGPVYSRGSSHNIHKNVHTVFDNDKGNQMKSLHANSFQKPSEPQNFHQKTLPGQSDDKKSRRVKKKFENKPWKPKTKAVHRQQGASERTKATDPSNKKPNSDGDRSLFSFQRATALPVSTDDGSLSIQDSDEDCESVVTAISSANGSSGSQYSSESEEESEVMSELSVSSSVQNDEEFNVGKSLKSQMSYSSNIEESSQNETTVSTFWDIENCAIPANKSAVDFVQKVRRTFYKERTEDSFVIACDVVKSLSPPIIKELDEANVTVIHSSCENKNAADEKLKALIRAFQERFRMRGAAIVLITSDSDFSSYLNNLQFKHKIHVDLICRKDSRLALKESANNTVFYEDFVKDLPEKSADLEYFLILTNFPQCSQQREIKTLLSRKVACVNERLRVVSPTEYEMVFTNIGALERAKLCLSGLVIGGNEINIYVKKIKKATKKQVTKSGKKVEQVTSKAIELQENIPELKRDEVNISGNVKEKDEVSKEKKVKKKAKKIKTKEPEVNVCKGAALCIYVNCEIGNIDHWKTEFSKLWDCSEFELKWNGSCTEGSFLAYFKSLSQAQKAKKKLQKNQQSDPLAPKFIKMIKENTDVDVELNAAPIGENELKRQQVADCLTIVNGKKDHSLKILQEAISEMKSSKSEVPGVQEVISDKHNELNGQKVAFVGFTEKVKKALACMDIVSENFKSQLDDIMRDYSRECNCFSALLPIYAKKSAILKKVKNQQVLILRSETGVGRSTQLTQYLYREPGICDTGLIVCTQPREIAVQYLAQYVSSQISCSLGDIVGYQVGSYIKKSANTRILYMTDYEMLKMIGKDSLIKEVSCVIIDEAHERTVYTDLLLGMIKKCRSLRLDLKVIIASANIDTSVFRDYFNVNDDSILELNSRIFPIEDKWLERDVGFNWNYFDQTVETTYTLLSEDPGDILVFLSSPMETENALEAFDNIIKNKDYIGNVLTFKLHDKLDVDDLLKIFHKTPKDTRKVIFSTDIAQTSITIPGIRYVVDCGMERKLKFDAKANSEVLTVNFISKSSAMQRRGRAGRTQPGKCYRMYSKTNFQRHMLENSNPTISSVHLGQALLKLMAMGVEVPGQFDFVTSPHHSSMDRAMKQLVYLKAVNEAEPSLTTLGQKMSCVPVEPRLSSLIFHGIDENVGFEAVIIASLMSVSRCMFFRKTEQEEGKERKLRFCESESDFLTYFEIYKEWLRVPKKAKLQWCTINHISARSMKVVNDLANELISILGNEALVKFSHKYSNEDHVNEILLKIIFHAFSQNLCIFAGHHWLGFRSCEIPGELHVHSSSSMYAFGRSRPQYLVYDMLNRTGQTYLVNVSPVSENLVLNAFKCGLLEINLGDLNKLKLEPLSIGPIGKTIIIRDIIGNKGEKLKALQKQLKAAVANDLLIVDPNVEKGEVKIFTSEIHYEKVTEILSVPIVEAMQKFLDEEQEVHNVADCLGLSAIIAAGAEIRDIILPGEFRDVKIFLNGAQISEVIQKLENYGQILQPPRKFKTYQRVIFSNPICAKNAVEALQFESSFSLEGLPYLERNANDQAPFYKVSVSMLRRLCNGEAFFTIEPNTFDISTIFTSQPLCYKNARIKITKSKTSEDLCIHGLPPNTNRSDLETFLKSLFRNQVKLTKLILVKMKPFESSEEDIANLKSKWMDMFSEFTSRDKIAIDIKMPRTKEFTWNAIVYFENAHDGETAVSALKDRDFFPPLELKPVLQSYLYCRRDVFEAIQEQVAGALEKLNEGASSGDTLKIDVKPANDLNVRITVTSNNLADIVDARRCLSQLLQGDRIQCAGSALLEQLFTTPGLVFLRELRSACPGALILHNIHARLISLFGQVEACSAAKIRLNDFLDGLQHESFREIPLQSESCPSGSLKTLLKTYGYDLEGLKTACGLSSVCVDSQRQVLVVRGGPSSVEQCEALVAEVVGTGAEDEGDACPVCMCSVSEQRRRLEYCGHVYCRECLFSLLRCATDFPVSCVQCDSPIVVADVMWATTEEKSLELNLHRRALSAFAASRTDIQFCPTPDCQMLYRVSYDEDSIFECPSCNNSVCAKCCVPYHFGMTCGLYQCSQSEGDDMLKEWLLAAPDQRAVCPDCASPIEKTGGCHHVTCWRCHIHLCWKCLRKFPAARLVYEHQPLCPKTASR